MEVGFYIGAGTSGRLGVLDASEIHQPGSSGVLHWGYCWWRQCRNSVEVTEDQIENAINDLKSYSINKSDTIIGISCSGSASYVISALEYARELKAKTIYLITNPSRLKIQKLM